NAAMATQKVALAGEPSGSPPVFSAVCNAGRQIQPVELDLFQIHEAASVQTPEQLFASNSCGLQLQVSRTGAAQTVRQPLRSRQFRKIDLFEVGSDFVARAWQEAGADLCPDPPPGPFGPGVPHLHLQIRSEERRV